MLGRQPIVAFVATTNGAFARKFYEGTLGLKVVYDDDFALVCDANGTTLRIQKVESLRPQMFTVLGWQVANLSKLVDELVRRGVTFERYKGMSQDERGIWTAPGGAHIAWFRDPDGNTLSLSQA